MLENEKICNQIAAISLNDSNLYRHNHNDGSCPAEAAEGAGSAYSK